MARRVFFSFHYDNDINRSMTVRNSWVTQGKEVAGFIDKAAFEQICKSLQRGNAVIGVHINAIRDMRSLSTSFMGNTHEVIGYYADNSPAYFDNVADGIYDYVADNGYVNMGTWIENAAKAHGK